MSPIPYDTMMRQSKDPKFLRYKMVQYAKEHGVKPAAKAFGTTPKTVRKWLNRHVPDTMEGLSDQSRAPKNPHVRITDQQKQHVIDLKKRLPSFGAKRIKNLYGLSMSDKAIRKIWHKEGLLKEKRRKHKTKQNLREVKAQWKLFEQISMDTKDLDDIPELWPQIKGRRLPKVQYTAREVTSGMHFIAFADERSLLYSTLFAEVLIQHLTDCGVDLEGCRIQTDNGSEFIGSWNAREDSIFTKTVTKNKNLQHHTIPPGAHTWQADVESAHRLIEDEFYEVESFSDRKEFIQKAAVYNLWFNVSRKNSYKENRTPCEIAKEKIPTFNPWLPTLPPFYLDEVYFKKAKPPLLSRGYDVIPHP